MKLLLLNNYYENDNKIIIKCQFFRDKTLYPFSLPPRSNNNNEDLII